MRRPWGSLQGTQEKLFSHSRCYFGVGTANASTQTVIVRDATTGKPIQGAQVDIEDFTNVCWQPKATNSNGAAVFTTFTGLRTIATAKANYANSYLSVTYSATTYTISVFPTSSRVNRLVSRVNAYAHDAFHLAQTLGFVTYLGKYTVSQIDTALQYAGGACFLTTWATGGTDGPICFAVSGTGFGIFLAQQLGVPPSNAFDFYIVGPLGQLLIVPVGFKP